ncbi:MAG TPA: hypothetical protein VHG08_26545 [Longimicrobium sp.]|nr:hypothetical protein [Longimicrobium sp.]
MKEPRHDDERLSALLAGRLEGPERDELLAYLSAADEDREVFAHAAAILREMDEEDAQEDGPGVKAVPPPRREAPVTSMARSTRGWPRRPPRWAVLPALAGLVVLGWLAWPGGGTPDVSPQALAMSIQDAGAGLPFDASRPSEGIPGDSMRAEAASGTTPESAAQAGAFLVRLALAIQEGDSAATATLALQTQRRFDPRGGGALEQIRARAGAPPAELQPRLEQATDRLEDRLEPGHLRLGAWTEAARLAAGRQNAGYFRSRDSAPMLRLAERLTEDDPQARQAVAAVRRELPAGDRADWTALETNLAALLQAIAS